MTARQLALALTSAPSYAAADFVAGGANQLALDMVQRWPDWPRPGLVLYGPEGAGKTHLVHLWLARAGGRRIVAAALREADIAGLAAGPLAIEDVDRGVDEVALLHLYNRSMEAAAGLVLTGRQPAAAWPIGLPDLRSRLLALPAATLGEPDDALLQAVLAKLFADRQLKVDDRVLAYLWPRMERSYTAARALVVAIDAAALERHREVTLALASEVLHGMAEARPET
jgi:chromosomal replication initiation ATPase DnaA